jgi:hypothetical protein
MSVTDLAPAAESAPTTLGAAPPDQQARSLDEVLSEALSIIGADGQLGPDEQFSLRAFLEGVQGIARGRQAAGRPPLMGAPQQQGAPQQTQETPYNSHAGSEVPESGY